MNKKKENSVASGVIVTVLFSLLLVLVLLVNMNILLGNSVDFYEQEAGEGIKKDKYVSLKVDGVLMNYAETKHTVNFIPVGKDQHYILWLDNDIVISLTVKNKKLCKQLNKIYDETWDYIDGKRDTLPTGITVKGTIHTMDPEVESYYKQGLSMMGISSANMSNIYYVTIDCTDTFMSAVGYIVFMLVMIAIGIGMIVDAKKKRKQQEAAAAAMNSNNMMGMNVGIDATYGSEGNYDGIDKNLLK